MDVPSLRIETDVHGRKIINNQYVVSRKLGQGQYGKVLLATTKLGAEVAIKTINRIDRLKLITKNYLLHAQKIKREIKIMKECHHPNVVQLYSVIDDLKFDKILLVLEYCAYGELEWKNYNHYNEKYYKEDGITINKILRDVIMGLDYLHNQKKIIHRDLKPLNLLISINKTIKISDFGVSLILENNTSDDKELGRLLGTPAFFAPELCQFVHMRYLQLDLHLAMRDDTGKEILGPQLNEKYRLNYQIDLWSLGVILYCLIFHCLPFNGHNEFALFKNIVDEPLSFPKVLNLDLATESDLDELKELQDLITKLLTKDPAKRATIRDVMYHKFTTYDLSPSKIDEFFSFNQNYDSDSRSRSSQSPEAIQKKKIDTKLDKKDKKLDKLDKFRGMFKRDPKSSSETTIEPEHEPPPNLNDLEPVDDLLDLYFDDSSSFGSIEEVHERFEETTLNILQSNSQEPLPENSEKNLYQYTTSGRLSESPSPPKPPPHGLPRLNLNSSSATLLPPPQLPQLENLSARSSNSQNNTTGSKSSGANSPANRSPGTNSPGTPGSTIVTIGAGSPNTFKSMFSPSKRFFSRLKKDSTEKATSKLAPTTLIKSTKPTINSLSKQPTKPHEELDMFKPPSLFTPSSSRKNSMSSPRKDSISSTRNSGSGLSRITSSSSSLNLNGYLTDDNYSLASFRNSESSLLKYKIDVEDNDSSDSEEANTTLTTEVGRLTNINDYLDGLQ